MLDFRERKHQIRAVQKSFSVTLREALAWAKDRTVATWSDADDTTARVEFTDGSAIEVHSEWSDYGGDTGSSAEPPDITVIVP